MATPSAPAPARRYALTGVYTDSVRDGETDATTLHTDPVDAALAFLDATRAGSHTVLVHAATGDPASAFAPYRAPDLLRDAHRSLGRDPHGQPLPGAVATPADQARYRDLVRAQSGYLDSLLGRAQGTSSGPRDQPETLGQWQQSGAAWAMELGTEPAAAVLAAVVARYPDPSGPEQLLAGARAVTAVLRHRDQGLPADPQERYEALREGWPRLRAAAPPYRSAHSAATVRWWLHRLAQADPAIGPLLAVLRRPDRPGLAEPAFAAARRALYFRHEDPDRESAFAEAAVRLLREPAPAAPDPAGQPEQPPDRTAHALDGGVLIVDYAQALAAPAESEPPDAASRLLEIRRQSEQRQKTAPTAPAAAPVRARTTPDPERPGPQRTPSSGRR